jgi:NitT/TauT family transport system substrate-binding protein
MYKKMNILAKTLFIICFVLVTVYGGFASAQKTGQPIRMAYLQSDIHHLPFWVAMEKGFLKKEKQVEIVGVFKAGPEIMSAFAANALDMAYVGEAPTTTAVANKVADVKIVAQVNTEGSALVISQKGSGIETIGDLKDKTVAEPGHSTVQDFLLRKAIAIANLELGSVNIIVIKPPEMINALRTNQIDAFIAWEPYPSKAGVMKVGKNLATSNDIWADHPCCVLVADSKFLKNNPTRVNEVVGAHVRAIHYIGEHPDEAIKIGVKYTGMDEESVKNAMKTVKYTYNLSVEGEKEYVDFLSELQYIRIKNSEAFVDDLITEKPLKDVLEK